MAFLEDGPREPRHNEIADNVFTACKRPLVYEMRGEKYRHLLDWRNNTADGKAFEP